MDNKGLFSDALSYTKVTFFGNWIRWALFVMCALPGLLTAVLWVNISNSPTMYWDLLPLLALSQLATVIMFLPPMGYLARIFRGPTTPPEFDNWGALFVDGIRVTATYLLWLLPALILPFALVGLCLTGSLTEWLALLVSLLSPVLLIAVFVLVQLYSDLGAIRCARTNNVLEGLNIPTLTQTMQTIGWVKYIVAQIILLVLFVPFLILPLTLGFIPYAPDLVTCLITPFYLVFATRYLTQLYNQGIPQQ